MSEQDKVTKLMIELNEERKREKRQEEEKQKRRNKNGVIFGLVLIGIWGFVKWLNIHNGNF